MKFYHPSTAASFRDAISRTAQFCLAAFCLAAAIPAAHSAAAPAVPAQKAQSAQPARPDFSTFSIISDRNIFNTKRSPSYRPSRSSVSRSRPSEYFALTGTMKDEKGTLAFFDGNASEYHQVLKCKDTIAGFQITEISYALVKLKNGTNEIALPVNMQLGRENQGEWKLSRRPESAPEISSSSSDSSRRDRYRDRTGGGSGSSNGAPASASISTNATDSASAPGESDADILERLRRRREQE